MRDDIGKLPLPASAKRYARMQGIDWTKGTKKLDLFTRVAASLTNGGRTKGFPSRDVVGPVRLASPLAKRLAGR